MAEAVLSPTELQQLAKFILSGKCPLSKTEYQKLKRHRNLLRKLANMKGSAKRKKMLIKRNKKQIGGSFFKIASGIAKGVLLARFLKRQYDRTKHRY